MQTIGDIMTRGITTLTTQDTVYEAAVLMKNNDIGFIPILENGSPVGTVTDRDLVIRGYANKRPGSTSLAELMTRDIQFVEPSTTVEEAANLMAGEQIRRLLVMDKGKLVGVVALGDLAVRHVLMEEAGAALGNISEPDRPFVTH